MVNAFCRAYRYLQVCRARTLKNQEERHWQKGSCHILRLLPFNLGKIRRCAEVYKNHAADRSNRAVTGSALPYSYRLRPCRMVTGSALMEENDRWGILYIFSNFTHYCGTRLAERQL